MKAMILTAPGDVENFQLAEIDTPKPQKNEVLVKVKAISVNPVDTKTRAGEAFYGQLKDDGPVIVGWDISGEVAEVGEGVTEFKPGDGVFGMVNFPGSGKAYAEYVAAPVAHLAHKPANISHEEAAAATLAALTAWQVLVHEAKIQSGQRVLIHAAAGGVGHFAVQIAKHFGAYVIGTASVENHDFLRSLDVDETIDYKRQKVEEVVKNVDIVLDSLGVENTLKSLKTLRSGGKIVSILGGANDTVQEEASKHHIEAKNYLVHSSAEDMTQLADLLQRGIIRAHVAFTFPFEDMAKAHQQVESHKTRGKVTVLVQ
ncbi:NADP-dependent oxidoreductase [Pontibacter sp. E15-1]|uniref:NADP-dependent oxidoreductase n=1 Tax=Pontibacter sp. E15-1 TaxID=2919918 RepID=UPI001F4F8772|nr:NADP-dependent oxidoreductase [Pontibacter sp. E15-1]MCJ8165906.1 NADP-dependent oxidoreductase [Pontibacter sp. E15-1]